MGEEASSIIASAVLLCSTALLIETQLAWLKSFAEKRLIPQEAQKETAETSFIGEAGI